MRLLMRRPLFPRVLVRPALTSARARFISASKPADVNDRGSAVAVPLDPCFAVMALGGTQYKVATDDVIVVERLKGVEVGHIFRNENVLLIGSRAGTITGSPLVPGAYVEGVVEEHALADKVIIFKKKRRKGYRRWKGYRAPLTVVRVGEIGVPTDLEQYLVDRGGNGIHLT
mmetsp:Transcript_46198/g.76393  ORF Transcript_46198/g.76393 Transcript_46198/m.76393 type:complete len:172 (+) Transcript_46198:74-589(+)|eukprot:CAMPEP_0119317182 /NCGR_PEP_ID=MMETSP1333-20130426/42255_1 /TAXON_ID=418940 /ORGANISM="Scyphosphaera apsteinii, Strain RCC1455" /LENGTH=171 /DNA_ID=CAMNT_0007323045 /DNA_START=73 /DNA_END=588 /DNA_ORIENTATION=+